MDVQQKIFTAGLALVVLIVISMAFPGAAFAYGEKHGYQPPLGGNGINEAYAQETLGNPDEGMSGDDEEPVNEGEW